MMLNERIHPTARRSALSLTEQVGDLRIEGAPIASRSREAQRRFSEDAHSEK